MFREVCEYLIDLALMAILGFAIGVGAWLGWGLVQFLADLAGGV